MICFRFMFDCRVPVVVVFQSSSSSIVVDFEVLFLRRQKTVIDVSSWVTIMTARNDYLLEKWHVTSSCHVNYWLDLVHGERAPWAGCSGWAGCLSWLLRVSGLLKRAAEGKQTAQADSPLTELSPAEKKMLTENKQAVLPFFLVVNT
jgi:hypothetical protein